MAGQASASVPALRSARQDRSSKANTRSSGDLIRLGASLDGVPSDELSRGVGLLRAELEQPAGSLAGEALQRIVSAYPNPKDLPDPQRFIDAAIAAIEDYPALIVQELADPKVGVIREARYLPRIAELVRWCEGRIAAYERACGAAQETISRREREATVRRLQEEAETAAREERTREEAAKRLEPEILARLQELPVWSRERPPRIGEQRAREEWQAAMARRLARHPWLIEPYLDLLAEHSDLPLWATEQENAYRGTGWSKLSYRLCELYELYEKARADRG